MANYNQHFQAFAGGAELSSHVTHLEHEEARDPGVPRDLTGYTIRAEAWWEGCHKFSPSVTIVNPASGEPHYVVTLNEQQTMSVPLGRVAFVKLILERDGVTDVHAPIWLNRRA